MADAVVVWLRNDLRVADNPALAAAMETGGKTTALYIHETDSGLRPPGGAARWWLHQSLASLGDSLAAIGVRLDVRNGAAEETLFGALKDHAAGAVFWNRRYGPAAREIDSRIKARAGREGLATGSFAANVLVEPFDIETGAGQPYSVYTPFWRALRMRNIPHPLLAPKGTRVPAPRAVDSDYDAPTWTAKLGRHWRVGEDAARGKLDDFLSAPLAAYPEARDFPARDATSRLSPHLRFGEISPRQVWHAATSLAHRETALAGAVDKFLSELAWRDFNIHQLYHREDIATVPMQERFEAVRWRTDPDGLRAWQRGQTGMPMVDAGMRELWQTGYMHNRVRMLAASFLAKNLLIDWREGERWFWDCLVDADEANNPGNWQWVAGSGLDAAPYFRIFNPATQGKRFDPNGDYVRRWVPELAALPDRWIHAPSSAPADTLAEAGIDLGSTYPQPLVDLQESRRRALDAFGSL